MKRDLSHLNFEERLRNEAPRHAAPTGFASEVMRKISRAQPELGTGGWWRLPRLGFACGAVGVIAISCALIWWNIPEPKAVENPGAQIVTVQLQLPKLPAEQVQALAFRLDEPLEQELQYMIADTRAAIRYLASNFLPEK